MSRLAELLVVLFAIASLILARFLDFAMSRVTDFASPRLTDVAKSFYPLGVVLDVVYVATLFATIWFFLGRNRLSKWSYTLALVIGLLGTIVFILYYPLWSRGYLVRVLPLRMFFGYGPRSFLVLQCITILFIGALGLSRHLRKP